MSMLPKLMSVYRKAGYEPLTGYNSYFFQNYLTAPFTKLFKDGKASGDWGLALQEVMFLEHFNQYLKPKTVLVVGNAQGWSTIALSLIFPDARVVGIDPAPEGNALTNEIAKANGLNLVAVNGASPGDVKTIVDKHLGAPLDFVLIDAMHVHDNVIADFAATQTLATDTTVTIFHDILIWSLVDAFNALCAQWKMQGRVLTRTPSGMAAAWKTAPAAFVDYLGVFAENPDTYRSYRRIILDTVIDKFNPAVNALK